MELYRRVRGVLPFLLTFIRTADFPTERALSRTPLNILEPRIKYLGSKIFRLRPAWGTAAAADSASRGVQIVLVSSV